MRDPKHLRRIGGAALAVTALVAAYQAGRARAGVPAKDPLVYTGVLEVDGKRVTGSRSIAVSIFDQETGGAPITGCAGEAADRDVTDGHFAVPLPKACVDAIESADPAELWIGVEIEGTALSPRPKIAAVPFALQARQASGLTEQARSQLAHPDCPPGYAKQASSTGAAVCARGKDEIVRVGTGATAFWIDRYEATIWDNPDAGGAPYFTEKDASNPLQALPPSGAAQNDLAFALSVKGHPPSRNVTWFQAETACRAGGKRLPTGPEWLAAAMGTPDPGSSNEAGKCFTCAGGGAACATGDARPTGAAQMGAATACISRWGAEDMIGNVWEWTADWNAGTAHSGVAGVVLPAGQGYGDDKDVMFYVGNFAHSGGAAFTLGVPAVLNRGGSWATGAGGGVYSLSVYSGPASKDVAIGFRCVIPR